MIDFHSHILPEMDDGSKDAKMSLAMLQMEREQGVTEVVFTPHFYAQQDTVAHFLKKREQSVSRLEAAAQQAGVELLPYHLGAEVYYFRNIGNADMIPELCIGDSGTVLLEMPFCQWEKDVYVDVANLVRRQGIRVVLAHIERYPRLARSGALPRLKEQYGIRCQVNAATVLEGGFFQRRKLDRWLKDGLVDAISSDAHNCTTRATRMQAAYERLCGILGQPDADALTGRNNALLLTP